DRRRAGARDVATLMQTMGRWAEGQNRLDAVPAARRQALRPALLCAAVRLRRHGSLADLASDYYAPERWCGHLADEFERPEGEGEMVRAAAYWARLMEIRHPARRDVARP